ncbi:hypothetical protein KHP62_19035 [Rhodobacteraceae bacterium NNCM2]|nr:hypothetical protein [Coraliihabitans acroporae]
MRSVLGFLILSILMSVPARADFSSSDSGTGKWAREIALGRFEIARGATRNEAEVIAVQTRRLKLLAALYHDVYDGMCEITGPSRSFSQRIDLVTTTMTGQETDRQEGETQTIRVRSEYVDVFTEGWALAASPVELVVMMGANVTGIMTDLAVASREIIQRNGCGSPELDLFERNLAAIVRGEQSLQRRGEATTLAEERCRETGLAGLAERSSQPLDAACGCLASQLWQTLPETNLAQVEDRFSRQELLLAAALTPETWEGVQACVR